ncbi:hypothetical protein [Sporosarcina pasteurii]|uniref:Uncharacterized protein n=1 Tax=Sporosarcina pasteurii TaxID=1474 RepID=A0A380BSS2_SPOPA|nr:hypothetical protein [Sporosarcina pasteurii]MDS9471151.1 hypothetical protein [Sporosarcina pasteurii]QBQ05209.1 hypothetical protein E2C16_05780 [Sporosarcina pasteurii]SUJ05263.1 Uncharacterised protein [Sporosarcina pasteurii]
MKKIILFKCILFCIMYFNIKDESTDLPYLEPRCPATDALIQTTSKDKAELLRKLNELVQDAYPYDIYSEWEVQEAIPLRSLIGVPYDEAYFMMAQRLCNKRVADNSWLIKVQFPKLLPSASASAGIMFVTKDKQNGWYVWYTYR